MPIRFFEVWSLVLELKGELFWSSERRALRWRVSVEPSLEVDFGAQSGELCVWRVHVESSLEVDFGAHSGELCVWRVRSLSGAQSGELDDL